MQKQSAGLFYGRKQVDRIRGLARSRVFAENVLLPDRDEPIHLVATSAAYSRPTGQPSSFAGIVLSSSPGLTSHPPSAPDDE